MRSSRWMGWMWVAGVLSGCQPGNEAPRPDSLPLVGQTVEIVAPADLALREFWEPLLQEWHAQTGGDVAWREYPPGEAPWRNGAEPEAAPSGGCLVLAALTDLADADAAGWLSSIPPQVATNIDQRDIFPGLKDAVLSRQQRLIAAPVSVPVLLCYYRKDLLEAAGLQPPETWDEYQTLLVRLPEWAPGLTALEPCGPDFLGWLFLARTAAYARHPQNYSIWFDIQTGEPMFDSPACEHGLETARAAWKTMPESIWQATPAECRRAVIQGKAALALAWEPSSAWPLQPNEPGTGGSADQEPLAVSAVPLPGSERVYQREAKRWDTRPGGIVSQPGFAGFSGLVMGARAGSERAGAWNLLETLVRRRQEAFAERPQGVCREADVLATGAAAPDLSIETASLITDATAQTLRNRRLVCALAFPAGHTIPAILAEELASLRTETRSSGEILQAIQQKVASATAPRQAEIRHAIRRSAGLPAR